MNIVRYILTCASIAAMLLMASCDESTGSLGLSADIDQVSNSTSNFTVSTRSILMDKNIMASSSICYLGRMTDPETGCEVEADFVAQYQTFENYGFPDIEQMVDKRDPDNIQHGVPVCDSCDIRLYFDSYYGDVNNPLKLQVYEMSHNPERMLNEDSTYYTDVDLTQFLDDDARPIVSRMFTITDYDLSEADRENSDYRSNLHVVMPASFGQRIMDKFYENIENFKDSYHFTHNVMPGLYFKCSDGNGSMIKVYVGTLNIYFNYNDPKTDSIYTAMSRFAATPEVIQSTRFRNSANMQNLVNESEYTYLKTPAGIATEVTLPIDEVFGGQHAIDSISKASITFTRYNKNQQTKQLGTPAEVLMVRKNEVETFFKKRMLSDNRTSYLTSFSSTYNTYTFSNISRLLSYCKHEKVDAVRKRLAEKGYTSYTQAQFDAEEALWMSENPDWNKVVLLPITTTTSTQSSGYGASTVVTSVGHDLGLNSIRLVGGTTPILLQVVYSRFK